MKTAVSIPDEVFEQAERIAARDGKSRSQVYREALEEYLVRRDPDAVTDAMNDVVADVGAEADEWSRSAARQVLSRSEW